MPEPPGRPGFVNPLVPAVRTSLDMLAPAIQKMQVAYPPRIQLQQMIHWKDTLDLSPEATSHLAREIGQLQRELHNHPELDDPNLP